MKSCRYVLRSSRLVVAGCAFLLLLGFAGASKAADLPAAPEVQALTEAPELPAEIVTSSETPQPLDSLFLFDEAMKSRLNAACTWEWRCAGTDCSGYGHGQRRCCTGSSCTSWENTPICC